MRKLMIIRIVHTPLDMGSAKEGLVKDGISRMGRERWEENQRRIEKFWDEVESDVDSMGLDYEKTRVYQDGLPCAGAMGEKIIRDTADKGSRNYQIIKKLMDKGAKIEATESPQLLMQEYSHIKAILDAGTENEKAEAEAKYGRVRDRLMLDRDAFIAGSINSTLKDGETGILFIGASHNVLPGIAGDIEAKVLD